MKWMGRDSNSRPPACKAATHTTFAKYDRQAFTTWLQTSKDEGETMRAGQVMQYVITDYYRKNARKRSVPVELINERTTYDARRYIELLAETCNSVTAPFGYTIDTRIYEMIDNLTIMQDR